MSTRLTISRLGAQGDGIADTPGGPVFVPFALPGEIVTAAINKDRADLIAVIEASPQRVKPTLPTFRDLRRLRAAAPGRERLPRLQARDGRHGHAPARARR